MAFTTIERKRLLEIDLPASSEVREEVAAYLSKSNLEVSDLAHRIGYSRPALANFIRGSYQNISANDRAIRAALVEYMRKFPIGQVLGVEEGKMYRTGNVRLLELYFQSALLKSRAYYLYGPPGTQKSFILRRLAQQFMCEQAEQNGSGGCAVYVYCRPGIRPNDLLRRIAEGASVPSQGGIERILRNFRFDLRDRKIVIIFDEAQQLDNRCIETVRELFDCPPHAGLLFAGSHNLKQIFQQVELEQWRSRLHEGKALPGISVEEAKEIIVAELGSRPAKQVQVMIESSSVEDPRQGKDYSYISARRLFWSIREIKEALSANGN